MNLLKDQQVCFACHHKGSTEDETMYKILIADDEVIERTILEKRIKKYYKDDCEIRTAGNGREILQIYEVFKPEILILDIEMPVINGLEAAREIRRRDKLCSIIFLTAFDEFSYAREAISVRAVDYLLKPCSENELLLAVDEACRIFSLLSSIYAGGGSTEDRKALLYAAAMEAENRPFVHQAGEKDPSKENQSKLLNYIHNHYMEDISVQDIAVYLGYSEVYSCRIFKQYFGENFVSYLAEYRMKKAADLLQNSNMSIKEIGKAVGYSNSNYFAKVFHRLYDMTPSEFRDKTQDTVQKFIH